MKYFVLLFVGVVIATVAARPDTTYTTKYDGIDIEQILKSDRLFNNYYKCLLDEGKCTPDGSELKRLLPDALKTNCSKCSERQRAGTDRVIRFLIDNKTKQWDTLQKRYDPENVYTRKYAGEAQNRGIKVPTK